MFPPVPTSQGGVPVPRYTTRSFVGQKYGTSSTLVESTGPNAPPGASAGSPANSSSAAAAHPSTIVSSSSR